MKKMLNTACAISGGSFMGFYANQLDTIIGRFFFTLGTLMVISSILIGFKIDKQNKE